MVLWWYMVTPRSVLRDDVLLCQWGYLHQHWVEGTQATSSLDTSNHLFQYGLTGDAISQANPSIDCSNIQAGTAVSAPIVPSHWLTLTFGLYSCIPSPGTPCAENYTSKAGDTCTTVANQFGVTSAQISPW